MARIIGRPLSGIVGSVRHRYCSFLLSIVRRLLSPHDERAALPRDEAGAQYLAEGALRFSGERFCCGKAFRE